MLWILPWHLEESNQRKYDAVVKICIQTKYNYNTKINIFIYMYEQTNK